MTSSTVLLVLGARLLSVPFSSLRQHASREANAPASSGFARTSVAPGHESSIALLGSTLGRYLQGVIEGLSQGGHAPVAPEWIPAMGPGQLAMRSLRGRDRARVMLGAGKHKRDAGP